MTKSGLMAEPPAPAATAAEAMKEWRQLSKAIADGDGRLETYDEAARTLSALRYHRFSRGRSVALRASQSPTAPPSVPEHFLCPISSDLMSDPVIVASGQTFDRHFIQEWLNSGNRTCPRTGQVLSNTILIPNILVRDMIAQWCIEHGITQLKLEEEGEGLVTRKERNTLETLLHKISDSTSILDRKEAMKDLRSLTKRSRSFRALVGEKPDAIDQLLSVLAVAGSNDDMELQENTVTAILNLSIHDSNKKTVGDNPRAVPLLIEALKAGGTMESRANAAAALFSLSALDHIKIKIGELGALEPLVELLECGSPAAKRDAGSAIFSLCTAHENRPRAVREGLVDVLLKAIDGQSLVDESLSILALLSGDQEATERIAEAGGVRRLMCVIRGNSSPRTKENAAAVLYSICVSDRSKMREIGQEESQDGCISQLAENGTSRARRKANGILDRWKRTSHSPHCSC